MLGLEDLLVANLVVRQGLVGAEALRPLLAELDAAPARVSLPRTLCERGLARVEDAQALLAHSRQRMRQLFEQAYVAQARQRGWVAGNGLEAAVQEQAREGYVRPLGEKLLERGLLQPPQHEALTREASRAFGAHEAQVLQVNRGGGWVQTLGPPPAQSLSGSASGRHRLGASSDGAAMAASGRHPAAGAAVATPATPLQRHQAPPGPEAPPRMPGPEAPPRMAGLLGAAYAPPQTGMGASGVRGLSNSGVRPLPPPPPPAPPPRQPDFDPEDAERTVTLQNPHAPFGEQDEDEEPGFDPGRTIGFLDTIDTPEDPERTISLPGGAAQAPGLHKLPVRPAAPGDDDAADPDRTINLPGPAAGGAPGPSAFGLSASQEDNDPFKTIGMQVGRGGPMDDTTNLPPIAAKPEQGPPSSIHGKYQVVRELGRGNMGVVYLARDPQREELVAVKLVKGPQNDEAKGRFKREILVSKRLQHDNVIAVFDAGEQPDGSSYMVMEYLEGRSLRDLLKDQGPLPWARALDLGEQLLAGLAAVHGSGIVHRDVKPDNVQVLDRLGGDFVKLMDFGISRFLDQDVAEQEQVFVTMRGTLSGTPAYVAPEAVLEPEVVRHSHDIYAFGVTLYEMLTGQLPFPPSRNLRDLLADTLHAKPRPLDEVHPAGAPYPEPLRELLHKLLEKEPESRPETAAEALELLVKTRRRIEGKEEEEAPKSGKRRRPAPARKEPITTRIVRAITGLFKRKKLDEQPEEE